LTKNLAVHEISFRSSNSINGKYLNGAFAHSAHCTCGWRSPSALQFCRCETWARQHNEDVIAASGGTLSCKFPEDRFEAGPVNVSYA
jgi:hypothetical protein